MEEGARGVEGGAGGVQEGAASQGGQEVEAGREDKHSRLQSNIDRYVALMLIIFD